jgi:transcriptional regulator with GAF, ATPase, and Fis domain
MTTARAWMRRLGDAEAATWSAFAGALQQRQVLLSDETTEPDMPGLLLLPPVGDEVLEALALQARQSLGPVLALALRRSDLGNGGSWRVLQAGASDVVVLEECDDPAAAVCSRLQRIAEVAALVHSPLVRQHLVGESRCWRRIIRQVVEVACFSGSSLLITGESGTGKELVARLVHLLDARPNKGKLVVLDCTTVVPALSGSEFFGHERGAFTNAVAARDGAFALAHQGTLFLDEVGELPLSLQAELLRVIQERTYKRVGSHTWQQADFRLVCATNRDLPAEEARGNFRLDFFHRIAGSHCHLPPLRDHREDILPLARHFLRQTGEHFADVDFDSDVQEMLVTRDYPGNIRELRQLVLRIARRHAGPGPITVGAVAEEDRSSTLELLNRDWRDEPFQNAIRRALARGAGLQEIKDQTVDVVIEIALASAVGNLQRAAIKLGVTDRALQLRRAARRDGGLHRDSSALIPRPETSTDRETRPPAERPAP